MHTYSLRTRLADVKLRAYGADGRNAIRCQAGGDVAVADEGLAEPRPAGRGGRGTATPTGPNERHAPQIAMARATSDAGTAATPRTATSPSWYSTKTSMNSSRAKTGSSQREKAPPRRGRR